MTDYQDDQYLDCKGLNCPLPILKTKKALDGINSGEILKMVATDPGSVNDVQAFTGERDTISSNQSPRMVNSPFTFVSCSSFLY